MVREDPAPVRQAIPADRTAVSPGFTLVEVLVSLAVVALLLLILLSMTNQITTVWNYTTGRSEQFRESREAFETITRRLSLATLNTYSDYVDASGGVRTFSNSATFTPASYARQSELRFISGPMVNSNPILSVSGSATPPPNASWITHGVFFQAPRGASEPGVPELSGLPSMLNTWGYFVEFGPDSSTRPVIQGIADGVRVPFKSRFRLYEMIQPANQLSVYNYTSGNADYNGKDWFTGSISSSSRPVHVLADNIVALVILPKLASQDVAIPPLSLTDPKAQASVLAPAYLFDSTSLGEAANHSAPKEKGILNSKNQLPPMIQIAMVAIDETTANRVTQGVNPPAFNALLNTLFADSNKLDEDLSSLQAELAKEHINYRVFTTTMRIKGAKWSQEQTN